MLGRERRAANTMPQPSDDNRCFKSNAPRWGRPKHRIFHSQCFPSSDVLKWRTLWGRIVYTDQEDVLQLLLFLKLRFRCSLKHSHPFDDFWHRFNRSIPTTWLGGLKLNTAKHTRCPSGTTTFTIIARSFQTSHSQVLARKKVRVVLSCWSFIQPLPLEGTCALSLVSDFEARLCEVGVWGTLAITPILAVFLSLGPCSSKSGNDGMRQESNKRSTSTLWQPKWCSWLAALHLLQFTQKKKILKLPLLYSLCKCFATEEGVQHFLPFQAGILSVSDIPRQKRKCWGATQESSNSNTSTFGQPKHRITHSQCFPSSDVLKPKPFQVDLLWSLLIEAQCPLWWSARIVGPASIRQLCIECCGRCRSKVSVRGSPALLPFKLPSFRFEPCFKLGCDRSNKRNASTLSEPKWCSWLAALHLLQFKKKKILKLPLLYSLCKCFSTEEGVQHFLPFQAGILSVSDMP